jgi:hypothetical protein
MGMFGVSGVAAAFGAMVAVAAAILGLTNVVQPWLAALIVAGVLFASAGMLALIGMAGVRRNSPPIPREALESTREDVAVVREAVRR